MHSPIASGRWEVRQRSGHRMRGFGGVSDLQGGSAFSWSNRRKACSKESWRTLRIQLTADPQVSKGRVEGSEESVRGIVLGQTWGCTDPYVNESRVTKDQLRAMKVWGD